MTDDDILKDAETRLQRYHDACVVALKAVQSADYALKVQASDELIGNTRAELNEAGATLERLVCMGRVPFDAAPTHREAQAARWRAIWDSLALSETPLDVRLAVVTFARVVAAEEREECAKVAEGVAFYEDGPAGYAEQVARAIRAGAD